MTSIIYHLEMRSPDDLRGSGDPAGLELRAVRDPATSERLYREIGGAWQWRDRLVWDFEEWRVRVGRDKVLTWVVFFEGQEAGFVELEREDEGSVEIVYFGLHSHMIGQGLGGATLTLAVREAWKLGGVRRVWLHTCSEDHPHALANYEKRGFRMFKAERKECAS